jgi:hypothetical protein
MYDERGVHALNCVSANERRCLTSAQHAADPGPARVWKSTPVGCWNTRRSNCGAAALQGVYGIDQQQAIVGIDLGVGVKSPQLPLTQTHKDLHHAMRVRPLGRVTQHVRDAHVGGEIGAADEGRPRSCAGPTLLRPPQAKLQQQPPSPAVANTRRFGGDECLVVEVVEQRRLRSGPSPAAPGRRSKARSGAPRGLRRWRAE